MNLLAWQHENGRRFKANELVEEGDRIAVGLDLGALGWDGRGSTYKVFSFEDERVVLLQDCRDRDEALALLAGA